MLVPTCSLNYHPPSCRFVFDVYDTDGSGEIDQDELVELIRAINESDSKVSAHTRHTRHDGYR